MSSLFWYSIFLAFLQTQDAYGIMTWPYGKGILLKPKTGCPTGWKDNGFFLQDTVDENPSNRRSKILHIDGNVGRSYVVRSFCVKSERISPGTATYFWPSGRYCIYRNEKWEPHGLTPGSIQVKDEDQNNKDTYKLTYALVNIEKSRKRLWKKKLYFACKTNGDKKIPIKLPITKPFYLLPYGSRDCQQVKWMVATTEWIKYHTRNYGSPKGKSVPYHEKGSKNNPGITMYYCYYESCNSTLNETKGVFQSPGFPGKYPDGQLCSWRIIVPANHTVQVSFTHFSLYENDTLQYSKSINDSLIYSYTLYDEERPFSLTSNSDLLFVLRSDESNASSGFRAEYRVFIPSVFAAPTEIPTMPITTQSISSMTSLSTKNPSPRTKMQTNTFKTTIKSAMKAFFQHGKSKAEPFKNSLIHSWKNMILVIVIPSVCFLIGVILVFVIIHQYRARIRRNYERYSKREAKAAAGFVVNPTYERGVILQSPTSATQATSTEQTWSESKETDYVKDSGPNPLYHMIEGPACLDNGQTEDQA